MKQISPHRDEFYLENDRVVFSAWYHFKRGQCCESGCRHCPYGFNKSRARPKVTMSWSGGKDSVFALHKIIANQNFEVDSLHTVIDEESKRIALHEIPEALIEKQSDSIGIRLEKIYRRTYNEQNDYTSKMKKFYGQCVDEGITGVVFGDIFLKDLREYKLNLLKPFGLTGYFPLWGLHSRQLLKDFLDVGFKIQICAARADLFSKEQVGDEMDDQFLKTVPPHVDPCGENGEFHTFVYDGPIFTVQIPFLKGDIVEKAYSYNKTASNGLLEKVRTTFWVQHLHI
jgi:uncharacterized protein (TIGR00290 family)